MRAAADALSGNDDHDDGSSDAGGEHDAHTEGEEEDTDKWTCLRCLHRVAPPAPAPLRRRDATELHALARRSGSETLVLTACLIDLLEAAGHDELLYTCSGANLLEAIAAAMRASSGNALAQQCCMQLLGEMFQAHALPDAPAPGAAAISDRALAVGVPRAVVRAMRSHAGHEEVQRNGMFALFTHNLLSESAAATAAVHAGALDVVLAALRTFAAAPRTARAACATFRVLKEHKPAPYARDDDVWLCAAIQTFARALHAQRACPVVQAEALQLLLQLVEAADTQGDAALCLGSATARDAGVVEAAAAALTTHADDALVALRA
jgi:hypothetical protein